MANQALQIERTADGIIASMGNVIFDSVKFTAGSISYDALTGIITFEESGRYIINWCVATQTAFSTSGAMFAISSSQGDFISGNSPVKTGEVTGFAIIDVTTAPVTAALVNAGAGNAYYATTTPLKAVLMVFQDNIPGLAGSSVCLASSQMVHILRQIIDLYPNNTVSVFTTTLATGNGFPYQLFASPDAEDAGIFLIRDANDAIDAFPISGITAVYVGDAAVYDPSITYITPPSPLPKGCDTDLIAAIRDYLPVGTEVEIRMGVNTVATGNIYRSEYGVIVLSDADGNTPIFMPVTKIVTITIIQQAAARNAASPGVSIQNDPLPFAL